MFATRQRFSGPRPQFGQSPGPDLGQGIPTQDQILRGGWEAPIFMSGAGGGQPSGGTPAPYAGVTANSSSENQPDEGRSGGMFGGGRRRSGFDSRGFAGSLAAMLMASSGNSAGANIAMQMMTQRQRQQAEAAEAEREAATRESAFNNMVKQGMTPGDAELAMLNPTAFGENFNQRFRTRELSEGRTAYTPGFGENAPQLWTAPRTVEDGPNQVRVDANTGTSRVIFEGDTEAEHAADALGLQPGEARDGFMRDYMLRSSGPTAVALDRARISTTQRGQDLADARGRRGQDMSSADQRRGQDITDARGRRGQDLTDVRGRRGQDLSGSRGRGRGRAGATPPGERIIVNPRTGQRMRLQGGQWVPVG